ncbi:hypothetical protein CEXT_95221 [Caerostris extrusa]|uniref:Uncharacterized protein n=1 Tax=Caerostris extrusa TaxID=172846 RepID=A0AAV4PF40_CAEEX|nr:hypothetical protein CEXT_95221 [Caerostris extrusa]
MLNSLIDVFCSHNAEGSFDLFASVTRAAISLCQLELAYSSVALGMITEGGLEVTGWCKAKRWIFLGKVIMLS